MNSPFANIFMAIQQRIQSNVTAVNYIDQNLGQLKSAVRPGVAWPCVLIDFEDFTFEDLGENVQTATGTVVISLGFAPYSNSSQVTPMGFVEQALGYYDIEYAIHLAIQGWAPGDSFGHLMRTTAVTQKRTDSYRVRELRYSIAFEDYSTKPQQTIVPVTLVVTEEMAL